MSIRTLVTSAGLLGVAFLATTAAALAAHPDRKSGDSCFLSSNWDGWRSPSPTVIYLRIRVNDVYRLQLANRSWELQDPSVHLVNRVRGSAWICGPLDLDLEVVDDQGVMREPLIVKSMQRLTPDEVKAIPAKFRP